MSKLKTYFLLICIGGKYVFMNKRYSHSSISAAGKLRNKNCFDLVFLPSYDLDSFTKKLILYQSFLFLSLAFTP